MGSTPGTARRGPNTGPLPDDDLDVSAISPELVLVSPELARWARERLMAPPDPAAFGRPSSTGWSVPPRIRRPPEQAQGVAAGANASFARRTVSRSLLAAATAMSAGLLALQLGDAFDRRSPPPPARPTDAVGQVPVRPTVGRAVAGGGYVLEPRGHFRVSADGRWIIEFDGAACVGAPPLAPIPIAGSGGFRARQRLRSSDGRVFVVEVEGDFGPPGRARGIVRYRTRDCDTGPRAFLATLS